jgi:hypothetical protein
MATEYHPQQTHHTYGSDTDYKPTTRPYYQENAPSASKVVTVLTLFPLGAILLLLSGITLAATVIGLALASPLLVIFSPVLIPATLAIALAVTGFVTSGAFGVTAVSSFTWMVQYVRRMSWEVEPEARDQLEHLKRRGQDTADYIGQKTKDAGQAIQNKAHESAKSTEHEGKKGGRESVKSDDAGKANEGSKSRAAVAGV